MVVYYPFLGALSLSIGTILERFILKKKQTNVRLHHCLEFLAITLVMLPFIYFFWKVSPEAFETKNLLILGLIVFFAFVANLFNFYSIKGEKISNLEPARVSEPIFLVLLALVFSFFFDSGMYKSNPKVLFLAVIAGLAIILSHVKKDHLSFNKYFIFATLGSFFFALELVVSVLILNYYSSFSFYFLRCAFLFVLGAIILKPKISGLKQIDSSVYKGMIGLGIVWTLYRLIAYYGYLHLGVVSTTLVFTLSPVFIYLFASKVLREKLSWKNIVASIIIMGCVVYGTFFI